MQRVLITGAAGRIGSVLRDGLRGVYPVLRLTDRAPLGAARDREELYPADLCDLDAVMAIMEGVDAVVHLGGIPEEDTWEESTTTTSSAPITSSRRRGTRA